MAPELRSGGIDLFLAWERPLIALYLHAFTTGAYAGHHLDETEERTWIHQLFADHAARCHLWISGDGLAGFLLGADSNYDRRLPIALRDTLNGEPTASIAELAIAPAHRARGLGTALVSRFVGESALTYRNVIVRSNANADDAHGFYRRLGFEDFGAVRVPNSMRIDGRRSVAIVEKRYFRYRTSVADARGPTSADGQRGIDQRFPRDGVQKGPVAPGAVTMSSRQCAHETS